MTTIEPTDDEQALRAWVKQLIEKETLGRAAEMIGAAKATTRSFAGGLDVTNGTVHLMRAGKARIEAVK